MDNYEGFVDITGHKVKRGDLIAVSYTGFTQLGIFKGSKPYSVHYYALGEWGLRKLLYDLKIEKESPGAISYVNNPYKRIIKLNDEQIVDPEILRALAAFRKYIKNGNPRD